MEALGCHLIVEMWDCDKEVLSNVELVKSAISTAAQRAKANVIDSLCYKFNPLGITGVVLLAESHLSIHTWPEHGYAAIDIFTCGRTTEPLTAAEYLIETFKAGESSCIEILRGNPIKRRIRTRRIKKAVEQEPTLSQRVGRQRAGRPTPSHEEP